MGEPARRLDDAQWAPIAHAFKMQLRSTTVDADSGRLLLEHLRGHEFVALRTPDSVAVEAMLPALAWLLAEGFSLDERIADVPHRTSPGVTVKQRQWRARGASPRQVALF